MSYADIIDDYYTPALREWDATANVPYLSSVAPLGAEAATSSATKTSSRSPRRARSRAPRPRRHDHLDDQPRPSRPTVRRVSAIRCSTRSAPRSCNRRRVQRRHARADLIELDRDRLDFRHRIADLIEHELRVLHLAAEDALQNAQRPPVGRMRILDEKLGDDQRRARAHGPARSAIAPVRRGTPSSRACACRDRTTSREAARTRARSVPASRFMPRPTPESPTSTCERVVTSGTNTNGVFAAHCTKKSMSSRMSKRGSNATPSSSSDTANIAQCGRKKPVSSWRHGLKRAPWRPSARAVGADVLGDRVREPRGRVRVECGAQRRYMHRQELVVVVEEVEPVAARRFERDVRGFGTRERLRGAHQPQRKRAAAVRQIAMRRGAGRDDDDFHVRIVLRGDRVERALQRRAVHAADRGSRREVGSS